MDRVLPMGAAGRTDVCATFIISNHESGLISVGKPRVQSACPIFGIFFMCSLSQDSLEPRAGMVVLTILENMEVNGKDYFIYYGK